jgi:hypothetical protein
VYNNVWYAMGFSHADGGHRRNIFTGAYYPFVVGLRLCLYLESDITAYQA